MSSRILAVFLMAASVIAARADEIDKKFPLGDQLRILADDVESPKYQKLVDGMNLPDLTAEWQRVETLDNAESFAAAHGGIDKVQADDNLRRAYQRRLEIRERYLNIMRAAFKRRGKEAPFDKGARAEQAGTTVARSVKRVAVELAVMLPAPGAERHWPRFRGPWGQGATSSGSLPVEWTAEKNIVWITPIPGTGNSSPVIWGDRIFLTAAGAKGVERTVHCLDRSSGKMLWSRVVPDHSAEPQVAEKNGFASATPVVDGERVIAFFGTGGLVCYDFSGSLVWRYDVPEIRTLWGTASSPVLYQDSVILIQDQNQAPSIFLALDKRTGKLLWHHERPKCMGWSTPQIVRVGDHDELIYAGGKKVNGYDPTTGSELWSMDGPTEEVVPTIVVGKDLVYCASGRQGPTLALLPGGKGDVTASHLVWRTVRGGPHVPTPILIGNRLYTVNDTGIASCLDAHTGEQIWQGRIRDKFSASPIEAGGLIYCCAESGTTYILRAADKFEIVAQNDLGSGILASPAAVDGRLYLRTRDHLVCIGKMP